MPVSTRTVEFTYLDADGDPVAGYLKFTPTVTVVDSANDAFYTLAADTVTLDENGSGSITLACTDDPDLAPTGWAWAVSEFIPGGRNNDNTFFVAITGDLPDPVDLADLEGVTPTAFGSGGFGPTIGGVAVYEGEELPAEGDPEWPTPFFWRRPSDNRVVLVIAGTDGPTVAGFSDIFTDTFAD